MYWLSCAEHRAVWAQAYGLTNRAQVDDLWHSGLTGYFEQTFDAVAKELYGIEIVR